MPNYPSKENSCKNFAPNFFDKNKCQNCFRPRESHLLSDKDLSKAKPVYVGWLLLAPIGTDFDNPVHKSRKWQRRWFVLFEHGALLYALDDNQSTIPQGTINMNACSDVVRAETLTGQKNSLCIYLPEQKYFVRCEGKEEMIGWQEALMVFPNTVKEEAKRKKKLKNRRSVEPSQTKPVIDPSIEYSASAPNTPLSKYQKVVETTSPLDNQKEVQRSRFASASAAYHALHDDSKWQHKDAAPILRRNFLRGSDKRHNRGSSSYQNQQRPVSYVDLLTSPVKENNSINKQQEPNNNTISAKQEPQQEPAQTVDPSYFSIDRKSRKEKKESECPSPRGKKQKKDSISSVDSNITNSSQDSTSKKHLKEQQSETFPVKRYSSKKDGEEVKGQGQPAETQTRVTRQRPQSMYISPNNKENDDPYIVSPTSIEDDVVSPTATDDKRGRAISRRATHNKQGTQTKESKTSLNLRRAKSLDRKTYQSLQISPDLLNFKKGWLTKQSSGDKWSRYWFVLADDYLKYYKDVPAEESGASEGEIKLQDCKQVLEKDVQRNYGFQIHTPDEVFTLAAMTSGIRRNWIKAITTASKPSGEVAPDITNGTETKTAVEDEKPSAKVEEEVKPTKAVDEMSATERSQLRRQRIRERRKEGRSKTYDFAEFKPLVDQIGHLGKDKKKDSEVFTSDQEERTIRRTRPGSLRRARHRTMDAGDVLGLKKDKTPPPNAENEWAKLEPKPSEIISKPVGMVKSLQSEVEQLRKQLERANDERMSVVTDLDDSPIETSDEPVDDLRIKVKQQDKELHQLRKELAAANEKVESTTKALRECSTQLDITLSEVEVNESQLRKIQNELQIEKRTSSEVSKENDSRLKTLVSQLHDSEHQLKKSETKVLDLQQKLREFEHQISLQNDQQKETTRLQESNAILSAETEDQERKLSHMQEAYEDKCQEAKDLEEDLSHSKQVIKSLEKQLASKSSDVDIRKLQLDITKLQENLNSSKKEQDSFKEAKQRMEAEYEVLEDCNHSLEDQLKANEKRTADLSEQLTATQASLEAKDAEATKLTTQLTATQNTLESKDAKAMKLTTQLTTAQASLQVKEAEATKLTSQLQETSSQEASNTQLRQQIIDLSNKLHNAEQQLREMDNLRQGQGRKKSASSFKEKLTELEADMGDTGHMLAARLTALETPRKDDSDESTSSASSHSDLRRKSKHDEDARLKAKVLHLQQELNDLNTHHDTTAKLSRSVEELRKQKDAFDTRISALGDCLKDLQTNVSTVHHSYTNDKNPANVIAVLPYIESGLEESLKVLGLSSRSSTPSPSHPDLRRKNSPVSARAKKEMKKRDADSESPKAALIRLRTLNDKIKSTDMKSSDPKLSKEEKQRLFAQQISLQALIIAEMARALDRNKNSVVKDNQLMELADVKSSDKSSLLTHADALAQRLLLQSKFSEKLYNLQETYKRQNKMKTSSSKSNLPQQTLADLTIAHSNINYLLTLFNQRITELRREKTSAEHKSELVQKKLKELVEACKSQQVETISRIAVEIDTGVDLTPQIDDVPVWTQQADYGTLHGATSVPIDLQFESAFFESLGRDMSSMNTHVSSIVDLGTKLQESSNVLTKSIQPSEIGSHASMIAYEAISQAELYFSSCRLREDYESRMNELKFAIKKQNEHIVVLERSHTEKESFGAEKLKQLQIEHQQKVGKLMQQLKAVENIRMETTRDMDLRLANLAQKQKDELEMCNAKHAEVIKSLHVELAQLQNRLSSSSGEHAQEILNLKMKFKNIQEQQKQERDQMQKQYEDGLKKMELEKDKTIEELMKKCNREEKNKKENESSISSLKAKHNNEVNELKKNFENEMKSLKIKHQHELDDLVEDHNKKLQSTISDWSKRMQQLQKNADDEIEEERKETDQLKKKFEKQLQLREKDASSSATLEDKILELEQKLSASEEELNIAKKLCEDSLAEIQQAHHRQVDELKSAHKRKVAQLHFETSQEVEEDKLAMKLALDSLKKHHEEEMAAVGPSQPTNAVAELQDQLQNLSEQYSVKCVEMTRAHEELDEMALQLSNLMRDCESSAKKYNDLEKKLTVQIIEDRFSGKHNDVYELTLQLEIQKSKVDFLSQEKESLKEELDAMNKKCKYAQQKHQEVFKDLTTAKSMENKYKHEIALLKDQISNEDEEEPTSARYDVSKSKSQSNFQSTAAPAPQISRNSSDRFIRSKSLKEGAKQ